MGEWWETFFDEGYLKAGFGLIRRRKTLADTRFIKRVLSLGPGSRILDVCCGIGRHALELGKLGYRVTGVDISERYLAAAAKRARRRRIDVQLERHDMRKIPYRGRFDGAISMWTSFGYFEKEGDNLKTLRGVNRALKTGGRFLIELINRDWLIDNFEPVGWSKLDRGYVLEKRHIDARTSRLIAEWIYTNAGSVSKKNLSLRLYSVHELADLLGRAGFRIDTIFGDRKETTPTWQHRMYAVVVTKPTSRCSP